eukprot:5057252-Alexandrium_andersonii.AAC.1
MGCELSRAPATKAMSELASRSLLAAQPSCQGRKAHRPAWRPMGPPQTDRWRLQIPPSAHPDATGTAAKTTQGGFCSEWIATPVGRQTPATQPDGRRPDDRSQGQASALAAV